MAPSADPRSYYTTLYQAKCTSDNPKSIALWTHVLIATPLQRVSYETMRRLRVRGVLVSPDTVRLHQPLPLPDGAEVEVLVQSPLLRSSLPLMLATSEAIHAHSLRRICKER